MMLARRGALLGAAAGLLVAAAFGCGSDMRFVGPPMAMLQGGVSAQLQKAWADDETLEVRFYVTNMSNQMMYVNRDGFALRLPTGEVIQRRGMMQEPYLIPPGMGHNVWVKFEEKGFNPQKLPGASVIVGGISYANDPTPRVVGEVPLTNAGPTD